MVRFAGVDNFLLWVWTDNTLTGLRNMNLPCADARPHLLEPQGKGRVRWALPPLPSTCCACVRTTGSLSAHTFACVCVCVVGWGGVGVGWGGVGRTFVTPMHPPPLGWGPRLQAHPPPVCPSAPSFLLSLSSRQDVKVVMWLKPVLMLRALKAGYLSMMLDG